jgi:hypothetical protein
VHNKVEVGSELRTDCLIVEDHESLFETIECGVERGWRQAARGLGTFRF